MNTKRKFFRNKEAIKAARKQYLREYYLKNRDKILQRTNRYRADNIDKARQKDRERRRGKGWLKMVKIEFLEGKYCEICTENRVLELAHIVPRNGQNNKWWKDLGSNRILVLCPTHHKLFDKHILSENEYEKIREKVEQAHGMV